MSNNFIKRNLVPKAEKRGSKIERLLDGFGRNAEREALRKEAREEGEVPAPLGLPRGFMFRRRIN